MPKVNEQYLLARRQQIIDAAYRCFARKGFHQATMRDIYAEAGLSPGAVYHYFDSKHDIIAASFTFDYERSRELFAAAAASDDALAALQELLRFFFQGVQQAAALGAGAVNVQGWGEALVNPSLGAMLRSVLATYKEALVQIVVRGQQQGQIDPALDPHGVADLLVALYYGLELQLAFDPAFALETYTATVTAVLGRALRLPAPERVD